MPERMMTAAELASALRISVRLVREYCTRREPRLPVARFGRRTLFREGDVQRWIDEVVARGGA